MNEILRILRFHYFKYLNLVIAFNPLFLSFHATHQFLVNNQDETSMYQEEGAKFIAKANVSANLFPPHFIKY